jgi:hypothetical protein
MEAMFGEEVAQRRPPFPESRLNLDFIVAQGAMLGLRLWTSSNGSRYGTNGTLPIPQVKESPAMELNGHLGWGRCPWTSELLVYTQNSKLPMLLRDAVALFSDSASNPTSSSNHNVEPMSMSEMNLTAPLHHPFPPHARTPLLCLVPGRIVPLSHRLRTSGCCQCIMMYGCSGCS